MNGEAFAFFRWVCLEEQAWDEAFGSRCIFTPNLNANYLWRWELYQ